MAQRRRSLRVELIATLAVVLMMAAVTLSLTSEVLGHRRHRAQEIERIGEHARGLTVVVAPLLGSAPGQAQRSDVEQVLRPSLGTLGILAIEIHQLTNEGSRAVASMGLSPPVPPARDGPVAAVTEVDDLVVVDRPIRTFGARKSQPMLLRVIARPSPWTRGAEWQDTLVLALGIGIVLVLLGGLLLEVQVLRPLAAVRMAAIQVSSGDLEARAPEDGPREIEAMAAAFNRTTEALSDKITQIESQRAALARAEHLASVGRISAGVAHEVGNPLAAILGYVELLLDPRTEGELSEEQRALLERSREQIQRIQNTVGQLLEYARPARRSVQAMSLTETVRGLVNLLRHDARVQDVELSVEGDEDITALADPGLVEQIVQNLVVNGARAAKARPGRARVQIRIAGEDDHATIEIQDSGDGVPDDTRENLFEPFFSTAAAGEGSGLGLAISRGLAEAMDGSIECLKSGAREPLAPDLGPGATFRVRLPRRGGVNSPRATSV